MGRNYRAKLKHDLETKNEESRRGRDIGDIPDIADPDRREACRLDLKLFAETYYPSTFDLGWSDDHLRVIGLTQMVILKGGLYAVAMPRGNGKTSIAEVSMQWAILYGHRSFGVLIGSDEKKSDDMLDSVKMEFETNELLLEDFPESLYPVSKLEGIAHRCKGQLYGTERTYIEWNAKEIVLPTIPGSPSAGSVIKVASITGGIRGMKHKRADGKTIRPDFVIPDDPQTDESAKSASQCQTREQVISKAVLGLAGPGKKISAIMPCTVICKGDLADRFLDRQLHPDWNGTKTRMLYGMPENQDLWTKYKEIRDESLRAERGGREATEFYVANREAMDRGARAAWEARFDPGEVSAIQHAMNIKLYRPHAFASVYQNEPLPPEEARTDDLTHDQVATKLNRLPRRCVPESADKVTAFVDVQGSLLYHVVVAWEDDFTGYVIDYGTYPDQPSRYFQLREAVKTLEDMAKGAGREGQIYAGLEAIIARLLDAEWPRDDGASMKIERLMIDANWGESTQVVKQFCRQSPHAAILTPSHGKYIGASGTPMAEWGRKPGERSGLNWRIRSMEGSRAVRSALYDTNYWKTFVHARLSISMGDRGCLSLYGDKAADHRLFADHVCSEYRVRTSGRGREIDEWKHRPERPDNHWWDCLVGCAVAASIQGAELPESRSDRPAKRPRVSFAEMQRQRRERQRREQSHA